jgi:hypothetical protein
MAMARTAVSLGGFHPLYEFHTDRRHLKEFNPAGWLRFYGRAAALLRSNPEVRGVFCSTWWYDPQVACVSPRLAYLREVPEAGGASFYLLGESSQNSGDAIANSPERRRAYAEGSYRPRIYAILWPRQRLLAAAEQHGWESDL